MSRAIQDIETDLRHAAEQMREEGRKGRKVFVAVAAWLDDIREWHQPDTASLTCGTCLGQGPLGQAYNVSWPCTEVSSALDVARAYLTDPREGS